MPVSIETIKNRRDFLAASARGAKSATGSFTLLALLRAPDHPVDKNLARVGYTVTKKLGNAVARNRIKRRLREAFRRCAPVRAEPGYDYVVIARQKAQACDFSVLLADMEFAFSRITAKKDAPSKISLRS